MQIREKAFLRIDLLRRRKTYVVLIIVLALILAAVGGYMIFFRNYACSLEYNIKPDSVNDKKIKVRLNIRNIADSNKLVFYKGDMDLDNFVCTDNKSENVVYYEKDGFLYINSSDVKELNFNYNVNLGKLGKHGHRGEYYEDMLAFDGEEALMLPAAVYEGTDKEINSMFKSIKITYEVQDKWKCVVPFPVYLKKDDNKASTYVDTLNWSKAYEIRKASYTFGNFEAREYKKNSGRLTIYLDKKGNQNYSEEEADGINALYNYYSGLFGAEPDCSVVLLRRDNKDNTYLMAGSGSQTLAFTFDPHNSRDWELLGHRLFHAFFDSKVTTSFFHMAPQLWFYEGLATYYENNSMGSLPEPIKKRTGIDVDNNFGMLFKQYIYMNMKDQYIHSVYPMNETKLQASQGMIEFLHYTQAPLVIKAIEDISSKKNKSNDIMLKYILENYSKDGFKLQDVLQSALGADWRDFAKKYFFNNELLPLWYLTDGKKEDENEVLKGLNELEYTLWSWFRLEDSNYPMDKLSLDSLEKINKLAQKENVHFSDENTEAYVEKLSGTVFSLLKEYALRAKICGMDYNDPVLRYKLLGDKENVEKWNSYLNSQVKN